MKTVACVVVNYNDWERTISLAKKIVDYQLISRVIVVDNCSTDESKKYLTSYQHEKYIFVEADRNGGYGSGNNIGIKIADGFGDKYVLIANPDVSFTEECLRHMLSTISGIDHCAAIGAKETVIGTYAWRYTTGIDDVLSTSLICNKTLKKRYYSPDFFAGKEWAQVDVIPGCFMLIKTDVFVNVGIYDEDFFLYEEEKVVYKKLTDAGYCLAVDLGASFEHHHKDGELTVKKCLVSKKRLIDSKTIFLRKYRNFNSVELFFSRLFFAFCYLEMAIYATIKANR